MNLESVFQRSVTCNEALQNIHPLEDGSGQARLPASFTPDLAHGNHPPVFWFSPVFVCSGLMKVYNEMALLKIEVFAKKKTKKQAILKLISTQSVCLNKGR